MHLSSLRSLCAIAAVASLFLQAPAAHAQGDEKPKTPAGEKAPAKAKAGLQGYYAIISKELGLSDEQKKKLEEIVAARDAALKTWDDANASKVTELTAAQAKAKEAKDTEAARKAASDLRAARRPRTAIEDDYRKQWQALLTADQATHLRGYNLYTGVATRFAKADLTDEQKGKVKTLALEAGKTTTPGMKPAELAKVRDDLAGKVEKDILTQTQRDTLAKLDAEKAKEKTKEPPVTTPKSGEK
jgi:hypothetical protein